MKHFYFTEIRKSAKYGTNVSGDIYAIKKGQLVHVGEYHYSTGSYRGAESEIFNVLMNNGEISKKRWYNSSKSDHSSGGYFFGEVRNYFTIEAI